MSESLITRTMIEQLRAKATVGPLGVNHRQEFGITLSVAEWHAFCDLAVRSLGTLDSMALDQLRITQYPIVFDEGRLETYRSMIHRGLPIPPILIVPTDTGYSIWDGHHRYFAALLERLDSVPVKIVERFPYTRTFNAIAAAVKPVPGGGPLNVSLSISVDAFEKAFNGGKASQA